MGTGTNPTEPEPPSSNTARAAFGARRRFTPPRLRPHSAPVASTSPQPSPTVPLSKSQTDQIEWTAALGAAGRNAAEYEFGHFCFTGAQAVTGTGLRCRCTRPSAGKSAMRRGTIRGESTAPPRATRLDFGVMRVHSFPQSGSSAGRCGSLSKKLWTTFRSAFASGLSDRCRPRPGHGEPHWRATPRGGDGKSPGLRSRWR